MQVTSCGVDYFDDSTKLSYLKVGASRHLPSVLQRWPFSEVASALFARSRAVESGGVGCIEKTVLNRPDPALLLETWPRMVVSQFRVLFMKTKRDCCLVQENDTYTKERVLMRRVLAALSVSEMMPDR